MLANPFEKQITDDSSLKLKSPKNITPANIEK
jgi:hypothetical protein